MRKTRHAVLSLLALLSLTSCTKITDLLKGEKNTALETALKAGTTEGKKDDEEDKPNEKDTQNPKIEVGTDPSSAPDQIRMYVESTEEGTNVSEIVTQGISLHPGKKSVSKDGYFIQEVTYSVLPYGAKDALVPSLGWDESDNPDYDWDFSPDRKTEDYLAYELDTKNKKIRFQCLAPFGRKIIFRLNVKNKENIFASMEFGCERRVKNKALAEIPLTEFTTLRPVAITLKNREYYPGTSAREEHKVNYKVSYDDSVCKWSALFSWNNVNKHSRSTVNSAVLGFALRYLKAELAVLSYLTSEVIGLDSRVMFTSSGLIKAMKEGITNEDKGWYKQCVKTFVLKYHSAFLSGGGLKITCYEDDNVLLEKRIDMAESVVSCCKFNPGLIRRPGIPTDPPSPFFPPFI